MLVTVVAELPGQGCSTVPMRRQIRLVKIRGGAHLLHLTQQLTHAPTGKSGLGKASSALRLTLEINHRPEPRSHLRSICAPPPMLVQPYPRSQAELSALREMQNFPDGHLLLRTVEIKLSHFDTHAAFVLKAVLSSSPSRARTQSWTKIGRLPIRQPAKLLGYVRGILWLCKNNVKPGTQKQSGAQSRPNGLQPEAENVDQMRSRQPHPYPARSRPTLSLVRYP